MDVFKVQKNGYDKNEVETYIESMKKDYEKILAEQKERISNLKQDLEKNNAELNKYIEKNDNISDALVVAVETAKQIENSSKNIYELEIKRIRALYSKWENFLNELLDAYPSLKEKFDTRALLKIFSDGIDNVIKQNSTTIQETPSGAMGLRNLINRMSKINSRQESKESYATKVKEMVIRDDDELDEKYSSIGTLIQPSVKKQNINNYDDSYLSIHDYNTNREEQNELEQKKEIKIEPVTETVEEKPEEKKLSIFERQLLVNKPKKDEAKVIVRKEKPQSQERVQNAEPEEKKTQIKSISNLTLDKDEKFESLVDKFLSVAEEEKNAREYENALLKKKQKENGFDLAEALNPTDDLSEIMKSFDAFNEDLMLADLEDKNND